MNPREANLNEPAGVLLPVLGSPLPKGIATSGEQDNDGLGKDVTPMLDPLTRVRGPFVGSEAIETAPVAPCDKDTLTAPVVTPEAEDFTLICSWCSFVAHVGRGPVSHILCNICRIEFFPDIPEVTHEA